MADHSTAPGDRAISFGAFRLLSQQRLLLEGDKPVRLGSRALDLLSALVERPGELVGKDELMARAWRDTFVEEGNLKFQIGALRRALGDGRGGRRYIATSPGQGYRFVAPVTAAEMPWPAVPSPTPIRRNHNLPARLTRLIGRADAVRRIAALIERHRLLTIVGPGGIGKTSVALAAAETLINTYEHGAWLIDLAPLADPRLVPSALATVLGFDIRSDDPVSDLVAALRDRRLLLVLDNCGHVIEAAAGLAVSVLKGTAGVHIPATSREPLRVEAEHVQRLPPLSSGSPSDRFGAAEALAFPAIELFVERTAECLGEFELTDPDAPIVAEICRKLDGIPLAIELAAARVETFGVRGLATHLDDRFRLLTSGRRSGPPRHRTLRAALDWSYDVLSEAERAVLRRSGIFMGGFTLDAACAVVADPGLLKGDVIDVVAELVEKSLAVVETTETEPRLRLLETTRTYALERLVESGEWEAVARRHAEFYRDLFGKAETESEARPAAEWLVDYAQEIDNLRASLDWAFSPNGDASIGVALTAAAVPLWMHLSLLRECRGRVEQALAALGLGASRDARREMKLHAALATSLTYTRGAAAPEIGTVWTRTIEIAEGLDDTEYQLRALWGLWSFHISTGDYPSADTLARRFHEIATHSNHAGDLLIADRMIGGALHFLGDQAAARRHIESMLSQYNESIHRSHIVRFQYDQRLAARVTLARILWAQGFPEQAMHAAAHALDEAKASQHAISLCFALNEAAIPVALFVGDWATAERYIETFVRQSAEHALIMLHARALGATGVLASKRGDPAKGVQLIRDALRELDKSGYHAYPLLLGSLAEALGAVGEIEEGLASIEAALSRCERNGERWYIADLLRIKGELTLRSNDPQAFLKAETEFSSSLDWARRQGALSWELRTASSLARLWRDQHRVEEARELLVPIYDRFTEGFGTADLQAAKRLIDALS